MITFDQAKLTRRDQQVVSLLVQGCSNKEIGGELSISLQNVKLHLRTLLCRAGIRDGRKRVKLACYVCEGESGVTTPCDGLTSKETQISILVWEGLTNREIGKIVGTTENMIKNHLKSTLDNLVSGVAWNSQCMWPTMAERMPFHGPAPWFHEQSGSICTIR